MCIVGASELWFPSYGYLAGLFRRETPDTNISRSVLEGGTKIPKDSLNHLLIGVCETWNLSRKKLGGFNIQYVNIH